MSGVKLRLAGALAAAVLLCGLSLAASGDTVPEPSDYRMEEYKSPVPASLKGARVVSTGEAAQLWRDKGALFFDVMPRLPKPDNLPAGTVWRDKVRMNIPGSIWLPNVGYGALPVETAAYFRAALALHTGGDPARPVLIYCMTDCWMSWNAAKRAAEWGYTAVLWYPLGADGWQASNLPLVEATPYQLQ